MAVLWCTAARRALLISIALVAVGCGLCSFLRDQTIQDRALEEARLRWQVMCVCRITYSTSISYDERLGYPQAISYRWSLSPNWTYRNHWIRLWETGQWPDCRRTARNTEGYFTIKVISLTVLP